MTQVGEIVAADAPSKGDDPPRGKLRVKTITKCDGDDIEGVEVIVKVDGKKKKVSTDGSGVADFGEVPARSYVVKLKAHYEEADHFLILVHYPRVTWKRKAIVEAVDSVSVPEGGEAEHVVEMKVYRLVDTIVFKRQQIRIDLKESIKSRTVAADYGHWWTELGGGESYGWWPAGPLDLASTFMGVPGALNGFVDGSCRFGEDCTPTRDPHDGDVADQVFSPVLDDCRTDEDLKDTVRDVSTSYSGNWSWRFEFGNHCHTMQKKIISRIEACGFRDV